MTPYQLKLIRRCSSTRRRDTTATERADTSDGGVGWERSGVGWGVGGKRGGVGMSLSRAMHASGYGGWRVQVGGGPRTVFRRGGHSCQGTGPRAPVRAGGAQRTPSPPSRGSSFTPDDLLRNVSVLENKVRMWQEKIFPSAPGFRVSTDASLVHPAQLNALWEAAFGWAPQDEAKVSTMLENSMVVVSMWDDDEDDDDEGGEGSDSRLVGFARCISDGVFVAMVCDDGCVDPGLQERGLGTVLLRTLVKEARRNGVSSVAVFPNRDTQTRFFGKSGFRLAGDDYCMMRLADPSAVGWDSPLPQPRTPRERGVSKEAEDDACLQDDDPCILVSEPGPSLATRDKVYNVKKSS